MLNKKTGGINIILPVFKSIIYVFFHPLKV